MGIFIILPKGHIYLYIGNIRSRYMYMAHIFILGKNSGHAQRIHPSVVFVMTKQNYHRISLYNILVSKFVFTDINEFFL